jgi:UDP-N-acetylglucosamine--N-acetylmuramyl-(pentapeptide) pyrophosphoryl-undecaprenol N-acetylglucosamine transferase
MKILLSGGGTLGSVTPLLAIVEALKSRSSPTQAFEFYWLGTRCGVEKELVKEQNIKFKPIFKGKLRRYFSLRNFIDPLFIILGFFQSLIVIFRFKPDIVLSAGSFVSVPVVWASWLLGRPVIIHQQDLRPSLANRLISFCATKITVTFEKSISDFPREKVVWTGNPTRAEIFQGDRDRAEVNFGLEKDLPTVLFMGGGTGAKSLNQLIAQIVPGLVSFCQIIHLTGQGKSVEIKWPNNSLTNRYHQYELLTNELKDAYAVSSIIVCRAGLGTLTELANLAKPLILIPLPGTHQEDNGNYLKNKKAALVLNQENLTAEILFLEIKKLLADKNLQAELSQNIAQVMKKHGASQIIDLIFNIKRGRI